MNTYNLQQEDTTVQALLNAVPGKADVSSVVTALNGKVTYNASQRKITINTTSQTL